MWQAEKFYGMLFRDRGNVSAGRSRRRWRPKEAGDQARPLGGGDCHQLAGEGDCQLGDCCQLCPPTGGDHAAAAAAAGACPDPIAPPFCAPQIDVTQCPVTPYGAHEPSTRRDRGHAVKRFAA